MKVEIQNIKKKMYEFIKAGVLDEEVLDLLKDGSGLNRIETELWDYKYKPSGTAEYLAKTILQIVSFYNTYGGYLIFGVKESDVENPNTIEGIDADSLDEKQLRDKLRAYTGEVIDVSYKLIEYGGNEKVKVGLLWIPKRGRSVNPVYFGKNGPAINGRNIFSKDQAYIRVQDNCVPAERRTELQLLFSERELAWEDAGFKFVREEPLFNNLPDKNFICPRFVGRDEIIEELWRWLGDSFAYYKVLAGAGGKGKTSIAYEFAKEVCKARPFGFEKVIWMTGKKQQFVGGKDNYVDVPETHFDDIQSLLEFIASELAVIDEDVEGVSVNLLKKTIKAHLDMIPSFIVIDDVDSLELDQQRMVLESAMQLGGYHSRFLITTRMNLSASSEACIDVPGLQLNDYKDLVNVYEERFKLQIANKFVKKLHAASGGSPLMTESIMRLIKSGISPDKAINEWKGAVGEEVRKAALIREVNSLTPESKRILVALSYLIDSSGAELRQITGYELAKFSDCVDELSSLFLVSSPPIIKSESRYKVDETTALLVIQNASELVPDPRAIEKEVRFARKGNGGLRRKGSRACVGKAINQAIALLKEDRASDAVKTLDETLKIAKLHPDLLLAKGRCLLQTTPPGLDGARAVFLQAYNEGQRRDMLYEMWWNAERDSKHSRGMVDVATLAIKDDASGVSEWFAKRALALWLLANDHQKVRDNDRALNDLKKGMTDLWEARKRDHTVDVEIEEAQERFTDRAWGIISNEHTKNAWIEGFDVVVNAIKYGDDRSLNFERGVEAIRELVNEMDVKSDAVVNIVEQRANSLLQLIEPKKDFLFFEDKKKLKGDIRDVLAMLRK